MFERNLDDDFEWETSKRFDPDTLRRRRDPLTDLIKQFRILKVQAAKQAEAPKPRRESKRWVDDEAALAQHRADIAKVFARHGLGIDDDGQVYELA